MTLQTMDDDNAVEMRSVSVEKSAFSLDPLTPLPLVCLRAHTHGKVRYRESFAFFDTQNTSIIYCTL